MRAPVAVAVAGGIVALCGAVGCSGSSSSTSVGGGTSGHAAGEQAFRAFDGNIAAKSDRAPNGKALGPLPRSAASLPAQRSSVIKTAQLSLRVKSDRFADAIDQAQHVADSLGGIVLSTQVVKATPSMAEVVVRVPANRFDDALADLRHLGGGSVRSEKISGQDVGQEFVDLEARQRNLQAQQRVLLRLMNRAVTITDTIRVQNELSQVQGQIEQIHGRLLYLHDQADLSTISISMRETDIAAAPGKPGALHRAFSRAWDGTVAVITGVIVGAGVVLPIALLVGIAALVAVRLWRPLRRRFEGVPPPSAG